MMTAELGEEPHLHAIDALSRRWDTADMEKAFGRALRPLLLDRVLELVKQGAQVLDTRTPAEFAGGHLRGSISIGLCGGFNAWTSTVLDRRVPVVLVSPPGRELEAVLRLGAAMETVVGYLAGGINALSARPDLLSWAERITPKALAGELRSSEPPLVVDVREAEEWGERHIEGSINLPLDELNDRLAELPRGWRLVVVCTNGYRASIALSLMKRIRNVQAVDLVGGIGAWEAAGLPLAGFRAQEWSAAA
jgi:rhodanese-related sulfurtransferase